MADDIGFSEAIRQYLPQVLNHLATTGRVNRMALDTLNNTVHIWEQQFIATLVNQGRLDPNTFVSLLQSFVLQQAAMMGGGMQGSMQNMQPMYPQQQFGGYQPQQPIVSNYGRRAPMAMQQPYSNPVYGQPETYFQPPAPMPQTVTPLAQKQPVIENVSSKLQTYVPDWVNNGELVRVPVAIDMLTERVYPSSQFEDELVMLIIESKYALGRVSDIVDVINTYTGNNPNTLAKVTHKVPYVVKTSPEVYLTDITKICSNTNIAPAKRYSALVEYLENTPQNIYTLFEKIILKLVNCMLVGKRFQNSKNIGIPISVDSLAGLNNLAPESNLSAAAVITGAQGYTRGYTAAMNALLDTIAGITISDNTTADLLASAKIVGGVIGFERSYAILSAGEPLDPIWLVMVPETLWVCGPLIHNYPNANLTEEEPFKIATTRTGNVEHLFRKLVLEDIPVAVYGLDSKPIMLVSRLLDGSEHVYVKQRD